ncbi:Phage integrase [Caballeronia cordobensis]|uniref:Phage integrase n=1 Tax=Caballeronia cordobensis TaxID=1353886 RepID=A0A158JB79_CABCO|nr:integrase arm-type DNA-binding domain-containing protein [Caballeronia cordobensis]SAL66172.1 Phage integrase [Caballeronia cordobensis]
MAKTNLTAARVASLQCEPGKKQTIIFDAKTRGFGLRVTAAGGRSYILESRLHGRTVRLTIGDPSNWKLEDARERAAEFRVLLDKGIDPREQEAKDRAADEAKRDAAKRKEATVGEAWAAYLDYQSERQRRGVDKAWGMRHMDDHKRLAATGGMQRARAKELTRPGPLAELMPLRLSELTSQRIAQWLDGHRVDRPTMAALAFRLLRAFIRWCDDSDNDEGHAQAAARYRGIIPGDVYKARAVKDAVSRPKAKDGDCLQREQLSAWFSGVRQIGNPVISAYLQTLLLTGPRREELAALRWTDVDFRWGSLSLSDKVESEGRVIPLTPYVASLLATLPRRNEWVFSSPLSEDGRLAEPRIAHRKALRAAGLPHISLHGLRRSFGTLSEWCEVPVGVVAQIQGHKPSAIAEKHYRRRPLDLLRMWHNKVEVWMLEQAGIEFDGTQAQTGLRAVQ